MNRDVLHVNVTAFPIGVERVVDSSLCGRPVVIAVPDSPRAVALAVSREAYLEGVMKGMPVGVARKFCRGLKIIPPNEPLYRRASERLFELAGQYSPLVEPWRAGHFYIDITGTRKLFGTPVDLGSRVQREIRERYSLRNTVGLAGNKLVSRVASRVVRPRGLCDVFPGGESTFLSPLEVNVLPGIGAKTELKLADFNIRMVGELAAVGPEHLFMAFGNLGQKLHRYSIGVDESPVRPPEKTLSVREEETLAQDSNDDRAILGVLYRLAEQAGRRLRKTGPASAMKLEIIYSDHVSAKGEAKFAQPADLDGPIFQLAKILLEKIWTRRIRLRYICITLKDISSHGPRQLNLFEAENMGGMASRECGRPWRESDGGQTSLAHPTGENDRALASALDNLRSRYGPGAVRHGLTLG